MQNEFLKVMKDKRIASLDVLRVLSMFLVVVYHYIYHGIKTRPELQEYYSFQTLMGGGNFVTIDVTCPDIGLQSVNR